MLSTILLAAVVILFIYGIHRYVLDYQYKLPPGPLPLPFVGNIRRVKQTTKKPWEVLQRLCEKYGSVVTFYLGQYRIIVLGDSKTIHEAMVTSASIFSDRPQSYLPAARYVKYGVLFESGEKWQMKRRFTLRTMRDFGMGKLEIVDKVHSEAENFLLAVEAQSGQALSPGKLLANCVSNIICEIIFGRRFDYDDPIFLALLHSLDKLAAQPLGISFLFFAFPLLRFVSKPKITEVFEEVFMVVKGMFSTAVSEQRKDFDRENIRNFADLYILSELEGDAMPFDDYCRIMVDLFIAGTETTATSLNWTLLYLAMNPEIQQQCQDAIDSVIETCRMPSLEDRPKLAIIDAVMNEVFRHATIVPNALLHGNHVQGKIAEYTIPEQSILIYNVWALHHDRSYWGDPEVFRPSRWLNTEGRLINHSSHFMPFGIGPRICLGESLARVEYFVFLVGTLQRFTFRLEDGQKIDFNKSTSGLAHAPPLYKIVGMPR